MGVTGQEAVIREALSYAGDYMPSANVRDAAKDALAALVAERDAANEKLRIAACDLEIFQSRADQAVAERDRNQRKVDAYDAARAVVKTEGNSRAYYVLRAENAEAIAEQAVAERDRLELQHLTDDALIAELRAERDRYRDALEMMVSPRTLMSRDQMREAMRAALAVSTP